MDAIEKASAEDGLPGDPLHDFLRRFGGPQRDDNPVARGEGSGFIVSPDGVILTNAHVVRDAKTVTVRLTDHREFEAKVLGSDPVTDIAVLRIAAKDLPTVRLGNSDAAEVGDRVLFSPEDRYEVEVGGIDYIMLRERDIHAVAASRIEGHTGLYL